MSMSLRDLQACRTMGELRGYRTRNAYRLPMAGTRCEFSKNHIEVHPDECLLRQFDEDLGASLAFSRCHEIQQSDYYTLIVLAASLSVSLSGAPLHQLLCFVS